MPGLFKPGELRHLVDGYKKASTTLPDATRAAAGSVGMEIKTAWLGIGAQHGAKPGGKIARRKWNVGYSVMGGTGATVKVEFRGPIHLLFMPTKPHIIGAKHLTTRSGFKARQVKIGANAAFGGSNRGTFGALKTTTKNGSRRSGARALNIAGNWRAYAFHPGTKGERTAWPEAKAAALRIAPVGYGKAVKKELAKSIGTQAGGIVKQGIKL